MSPVSHQKARLISFLLKLAGRRIASLVLRGRGSRIGCCCSERFRRQEGPLQGVRYPTTVSKPTEKATEGYPRPFQYSTSCCGDPQPLSRCHFITITLPAMNCNVNIQCVCPKEVAAHRLRTTAIEKVESTNTVPWAKVSPRELPLNVNWAKADYLMNIA